MRLRDTHGAMIGHISDKLGITPQPVGFYFTMTRVVFYPSFSYGSDRLTYDAVLDIRINPHDTEVSKRRFAVTFKVEDLDKPHAEMADGSKLYESLFAVGYEDRDP